MVASLASCRGDAEPPPDATPTPTPTTPAATATPAASPTVSATAAATATAESTPTPSADDIATIRALVATYWAAFNDWDADRALLMLEPAYRASEEELIRHDIGRLEQFGVKLDVSEETPPTLNDDGDYETYVAMVTPIDTLRLCMGFRRIDGEWWIVFSGVVVE
ncbi:MAG: hypothetical protein F4X26_03800 [Chloroflexi bacterium]|nr:hypothetical protein [Chloroflexota bacterium]